MWLAIIYSGYDYSGISSSDWWLGPLSSNRPSVFRIIGAHLPVRACGCAREVALFYYGYLLWASQPATPRLPPPGSAQGPSNRLLSMYPGGPAEIPTWPGMPLALAACLG